MDDISGSAEAHAPLPASLARISACSKTIEELQAISGYTGGCIFRSIKIQQRLRRFEKEVYYRIIYFDRHSNEGFSSRLYL